MTSSFKHELVSEACKSFFSSPRCFSPGSRTQISTFVHSLLLPVQANPLPQCLGRNGELLSLSRACEDEVVLSKLTEGWYMQRPRSSHFRTDRLDSSSERHRAQMAETSMTQEMEKKEVVEFVLGMVSILPLPYHRTHLYLQTFHWTHSRRS